MEPFRATPILLPAEAGSPSEVFMGRSAGESTNSLPVPLADGNVIDIASARELRASLRAAADPNLAREVV